MTGSILPSQALYMIADSSVSVRYPLAWVNYGEDEIAAVTDTLRAGQTTCGPRVSHFEEDFATYVGTEHAVMVNSGSSADMLLAYSLGQPRHRAEVLIPAVTWPTQVWSCLMAGYRVRLVDVDPETLQMDTRDAMTKVSRDTRAIFLVHLMGLVGDMDKLAWAFSPSPSGVRVTVLEDCCEALGARWRGKHVGTFGQSAAFSFFFSHLLSTMEGGMVVTGDDHAGHMFRLWRSHGWEPQKEYPFWFPTWGWNVRPTELQGAFGNVQMTKLEQFRLARQRNAERLTERVIGRYPEWLRGARVLDGCEPSWHGFPIVVRKEAPFSKHRLCKFLEQHNIETRPIVAGNLARQPSFLALPPEKLIAGPLPGADFIHEHGFYIGVSSMDDESGCDYVGSVVESFMRQC